MVDKVEVFIGGTIGSGGIEMTTVMFGVVEACVTAISVCAANIPGSMLIPNLPVGAKIFFSGYNACDVVVVTADVTAASVVSASFGRLDSGAKSGTLVASFNYVAFV